METMEAKDCEKNQKLSDNEYYPPDGGFQAFSVVFCAFFCHGVLGLIYSYSVFFQSIYEGFESQNASDPIGKAALIGSVSMGTFCFTSPLSGILTDLIGIQKTTLLGGILSTLGMFFSSFWTKNFYFLLLSYSIFCASGVALVYTPSLVILGHYYKKHLGLVTGIVTSGTAIFGIFIPYSVEYLIHGFGIESTLRILSILHTMMIISTFVFRPKIARPRRGDENVLNLNVFRNRKYSLWAFTMTFCSFGTMVPYIYMIDFVSKKFKGYDPMLPMVLTSVAAGVGRFFFGITADHPKVDRLVLQQIAFFVIGSSTILVPLSNSYWLLIFLYVLFGLCDGCFASIFAPFIYEICDVKDVNQAIGFIMGLLSLPVILGPFCAGIVLERTGSYDTAFIVAGIPAIVGALVLLFVRLVGKTTTRKN